MKTFGYISAFAVTTVAAITWNGYVLSILWRWFVAGTFTLPELSINAAIGLAVIISYMTKSTAPDDEASKRTPAETLTRLVGYGVAKPAAALAFGWVVHLFA